MRSIGSLRDWVDELLPEAGEPAREAAWQLSRSLLAGFTASLCGLARQGAALERGRKAATQRQFFFRWLQRPRWNPDALYARLPRRWPRELREAAVLPLLCDCTVLGAGWCVLQVSVPFERRALPVYRQVVSYRRPAAGQTVLLHRALAWLEAHLPGPRDRYVLVLDRGFPSHALLRWLQAQGWRYVVRIHGNWKVTHADYTGLLQGWLPAPPKGTRGTRGRAAGQQVACLREGTLGNRHKGRAKWSRSHVVGYRAPAHREVWLLATSEVEPAVAVALYRQRMQIEAEFRDLKGPLGLDHLEHWQDAERVARLLVWVAVYEWRLALLWCARALAAWGRTYLQIGGALSWITITRAWVKLHLRAAVGPRTLVRESP